MIGDPRVGEGCTVDDMSVCNVGDKLGRMRERTLRGGLHRQVCYQRVEWRKERQL
jgi:hypothetical protein